MLAPLLSWSQSYPTQRVIGKDTIVTMTKKQAEDITKVFRQNNLQITKLKTEIDSLKTLPLIPVSSRDTLVVIDVTKIQEKVDKGERLQLTILTVWSTTVVLLTAMVYFLGI